MVFTSEKSTNYASWSPYHLGGPYKFFAYGPGADLLRHCCGPYIHHWKASLLWASLCTCCAQTPQIKRSTGSCVQRVHNSPNAGCTARTVDKNKAQICCSERTLGLGNGILLDRPLPFKLHQSYRPLPRFIREINRKKSGRVPRFPRDSHGNADLYPIPSEMLAFELNADNTLEGLSPL